MRIEVLTLPLHTITAAVAYNTIISNDMID